MFQERRILSIEHLQQDGILINLRDGTSMHLTLDQLLHLGVPRFRIPSGHDAFELAMRKAFQPVAPEE